MDGATARKTMSEVNLMDYEEFIKVFGNVIEHCSLCVAAVWRYRPFKSVKHLYEEICTFVDQLPGSGREGILRSHPDLAGRVAMQGQLTAESTREQRTAGMADLTPQERDHLLQMNKRYREKFGFPFVICARLNRKDVILESLEVRLDNPAEVELEKGIAEVKKICQLRLSDLLGSEAVNCRL